MFLETFTPHESFTLEYVSVRGAIGIMDGQGKEEISFDFVNGFEDGIIGITGPSGSGKTTIIENCHPYPCMLSRVGSLKDHFCLKDSHRILIYRSSNGKRYKITMKIDGVAKAVGTNYYVEVQTEGDTWHPVTMVNGSHDSYLEWVENTFGNKDLFLRTSFYTNTAIKNFPDLSQATKSEKMALFSTLAGTDFLSTVSEQAKLHAAELKDKIEEIKGQVKDYDNAEILQEEAETILSENQVLLEEYKSHLKTDKSELEKYNELQKEFIKCEATYDIYRNELSEKKSQLDETERKIKLSEHLIENIKDQLKDIELYKEQIQWYDENIKVRKQLTVEENELRDKFNNAQAELDRKYEIYYEHERTLSSAVSALNHLPKELESLQKALPDLNGKCPVCGAPLSEHKKEELKKETAEIKVKIDGIKESIKEHIAIKDTEEKWLKDNSLNNLKTELNNLNNQITEKSNSIIEIDSYMEQIDIDTAREVVNNSSRMYMEEDTRRLELESYKDSINKRIKELEVQLETIPTDYTDKIARLQRGIEDSNQGIIDANTEIKMAQKQLDEISAYAEKIKEIKASVNSILKTSENMS